MPSRPFPILRSTLAAGVLAMTGCVNPFIENYVGIRRSATEDPIRLDAKADRPRLGTSRFSKQMEAGTLPVDAEARAAASEVGAGAYWWRFAPSFSAANEAARIGGGNGRVGNTDPFGPAFGEKAIKWYEFEAVFYADDPGGED